MKDGAIRYVPLVIAKDNYLVPALSLEILRLILGAEGIIVNRDNSIIIGNKKNTHR